MAYAQTDVKPRQDSCESPDTFPSIAEAGATVIGWIFRMLFKMIFFLVRLAVRSVIFMLAMIGVVAIIAVLILAIHIFPRLDFTQWDIQFSDSMSRMPSERFDLSSVHEAQAKWAVLGVKLGLVVLSDSDIPLASGANKYLELAVPGLKYANANNERVYYSNSGFYVRKGQYFAPGDYRSLRYSTTSSPALARASQQEIGTQADYEPSTLARVYCLAHATDSRVRCDPRCRRLFAPKPDAGFAQTIAHSIECWGAPDA